MDLFFLVSFSELVTMKCRSIGKSYEKIFQSSLLVFHRKK